MPGLDRASIASITLIGALLLLLVVFVAWKMRHHVMCACCMPPADEVEAQEADSLMQVAQVLHSSTFATRPANTPPNHAVSRGFDHLPAYIAAKIASKGRKRLGSSPGKSRLKGQDLEMAMHTSRRSRFTRQKASGQWHRFSSEDDSETLIGTAPGQGCSGHSSDHTSQGSISPTLSEQYSIASCSYPPLPWPELAQLEDGLPLSSSASAHDLITDAEDLNAALQ